MTTVVCSPTATLFNSVASLEFLVTCSSRFDQYHLSFPVALPLERRPDMDVINANGILRIEVTYAGDGFYAAQLMIGTFRVGAVQRHRSWSGSVLKAIGCALKKGEAPHFPNGRSRERAKLFLVSHSSFQGIVSRQPRTGVPQLLMAIRRVHVSGKGYRWYAASGKFDSRPVFSTTPDEAVLMAMRFMLDTGLWR